MMRILHYHVALELERGGVVRAVLDVCRLLAAAGHEITLVTGSAADVPDAWLRGEPSCPRTIELELPTWPGGMIRPEGLRRLRPYVDQAEILHLHGVFTAPNLQLAAAARRRDLPYVFTVHGMLDDWCMAQKRLKKRVYLAVDGRRMLERAAAVHCTATAELEQARKWFPRGHGVVMPYVFDLEPFEDLPGPGPARAQFPVLEGDRPVILFLSRIHYKKGIELLLGAAERMRSGGLEFLVAIAGTGEPAYVDTVRRLIRDLDLERCVELVGFASGVEKISLYEAADVFVLPTSQENFGFVLFEALACRTPVVTTRGPDTWPEMESSGGGVVADSTPEALASAISALLADPDRRARMGDAGRQWVFEHLRGERIVAQLEAVYRAAIGIL